MATAQRSTMARHIPTLTEQGLAIESNSWNGLLVRTGVPDAVVARLNAEIQKALHLQYTPIHLGPTRLRTETAGLFALSVLKKF
jgi:hypothetical protein